MDLPQQLCCSVCGRRVLKSVCYLTSRTNVSLTTPSLTASPPSVPSTVASPAFSLSSWHRPHLSAVMGAHAAGSCHAPQWQRWPREHLDTCTPRDSAFTIPHITIPPVAQIQVVVMVLQVAVSVRGGGYVVLLFHPGASSKSFGTASAVMTLAHFHFHQSRKCRRMKGLSLNSQLLD